MNHEKCPSCGAREKGKFGNYQRWACGSHGTASGGIAESETCCHNQRADKKELPAKKPKRKKRTRRTRLTRRPAETTDE